jgi:DNA-binding LacI/PurR family transcriptional regulator
MTISLLAERLALSPTTVSLVLNGRSREYGIAESTENRVMAEAGRMHYRPNVVARQLLGKRSNAVGMLIHTEAVADIRLVQKIEMLAAERGIRIVIGHAVGTHEQVEEYLNDFCARGVDGIITIFHNHPDYSHLVLPQLAQFERVVFYEPPMLEQAKAAGIVDPCSVTPDYYECGRLATQHLIDRGRQRIASVWNNMVFPYAHAWRRGHEDALKASGRRYEARLAWVMDQQPAMHWSEPFTPERALAAVDEVVLRQGADGIAAINDYYAARVTAALHRRGLHIPDDVAVIGASDFEIATMMEPQLTTLDLRIDDLARAVAQNLFDLLDRDAVPEQRRATVIPPRLIVREST